MPNEVRISQGDSLWNIVQQRLLGPLLDDPKVGIDQNRVSEQELNRAVQEITSALARENNVAVEEWQISGKVSSRSLPVGFTIKIGEATREVLLKVLEAWNKEL